MDYNTAMAAGSSVLPLGKYDPLPGITSPRPEKFNQGPEQFAPISLFPKLPLDLQRVQALELRVG